ncbi:hypothetical protein NECAME_15830 [Necator americanus]|uniref:MSP domain-containing protein n=1 Tax=Necator americanus TaxID=51031 RepID=W2SFX6_NECAM|nr:hypothetical protein NECAME_15830 [Necator americanus]ETN68438.1 hypothetical protein NECAME_15830 [Necator americanus]
MTDFEDEDRLYIVDELDGKTERKVKEEGSSSTSNVGEQKIAAEKRQLKSRLPASLKNRIVRSSARSCALVTSGGKDEPAFSEVVSRLEFAHFTTNARRRHHLESNSAVCGKKRVFTHPRLKSGDRLTKLIDPLDSAPLIKHKDKKAKNRIVQESNMATYKKKFIDENALARSMGELTLKVNEKERSLRGDPDRKRTKLSIEMESNEDDLFYSKKPYIALAREQTSDAENEDSERHLTRARRRKLTRSLLRGDSSIKRLRKTPTSAIIRRRMPRIHCNNTGGVETFDSFLNFPLTRIDAAEDGITVSDLESRIRERVENLKKNVEDFEYSCYQAECEDTLGTEPFLDPIAYRRHPFVRRGDRAMSMLSATYGMHAAQFRNNSCSLSELSGGMWRVKPFEPIRFCRENGNKYYQISDYLDQVSGVTDQANFENLREKAKFDIILEEKIRSVRNSLADIRFRKSFGFVKGTRLPLDNSFQLRRSVSEEENGPSCSSDVACTVEDNFESDLTIDFSDDCIYLGIATIYVSCCFRKYQDSFPSCIHTGSRYIEFHGLENDNTACSHIRIKNVSDKHVIFNVRRPPPAHFGVTPKVGIIQPQEITDDAAARVKAEKFSTKTIRKWKRMNMTQTYMMTKAKIYLVYYYRFCACTNPWFYCWNYFRVAETLLEK